MTAIVFKPKNVIDLGIVDSTPEPQRSLLAATGNFLLELAAFPALVAGMSALLIVAVEFSR